MQMPFESRSSADSYVFAAIFVAIIFLPVIYLIWMFSSVTNFFVSCRSACKKDPVFGVIGVQKGPRSPGGPFLA